MTTTPQIRFTTAAAAEHLLLLAPLAKTLPEDLPQRPHWLRLLKRRRMKAAELAKTPLLADLPDGVRAALVMIDPQQTRFARLTVLRKAVCELLAETPRSLDVMPLTGAADALDDAVYVSIINDAALPASKKKAAKPLKKLQLLAPQRDLSEALALAESNLLARQLTMLAPNQLDPATYRRRLRAMAQAHGWRIEEYDFKRLRKMGAGAFCAVAQGSEGDNGGDAAIVHLSRRCGRDKAAKLALVGKGVCHDSGGLNLKPARYMAGMHEDMNGSAVALALFAAADACDINADIDCWLAIATNQLSPRSYAQNDIITALNGDSIEIMHTDAEGRMLLADAITLAVQRKPQLLLDFATLTGSMHTALGQRYSGVFASSDELAAAAVAAGRASGERVCALPHDADYDEALQSRVADVKQCTLDGDADHILAARFLARFVGETPWLHMDLSASSCRGGLGAVASDVTGFGVAWGMAFLQAHSGRSDAPPQRRRALKKASPQRPTTSGEA